MLFQFKGISILLVQHLSLLHLHIPALDHSRMHQIATMDAYDDESIILSSEWGLNYTTLPYHPDDGTVY